MNSYKTDTGVELVLTEDEAMAYQKLEKLTLLGKAEDPKAKQPSRVRIVDEKE